MSGTGPRSMPDMREVDLLPVGLDPWGDPTSLRVMFVMGYGGCDGEEEDDEGISLRIILDTGGGGSCVLSRLRMGVASGEVGEWIAPSGCGLSASSSPYSSRSRTIPAGPNWVLSEVIAVPMGDSV